MTLKALLDKVNDEKPNSFGEARLIAFVNEIEADVAEQVNMDCPIYTEDSMDTELMVPAPYDRLYVSFVKSQIDYANEEYGSYQNNAVQHVQDFRDYVDWVVRTGQAAESSMPARLKNVF